MDWLPSGEMDFMMRCFCFCSRAGGLLHTLALDLWLTGAGQAK
jgi:hypothetical protein